MMNQWGLKNFVNQLLSRIDHHDIGFSLLMALKEKNYQIYQHSVRVAYLLFQFAQRLEKDEPECFWLSLGGLFHDLGKINISPKILYKPDALTESEWLIMKRHPQNGVRLLQSSQYYEGCHDLILYHHEHFDGSGYTTGLKGAMIPAVVRMLSICDSFDAMISMRSYRPALSLDKAKHELLNGSNTQFDASYVREFLPIADQFQNEMVGKTAEAMSEQERSNNTDGLSWEKILDRVNDIGIYYLDDHEVVRYCNPCAAMRRGQPREKLCGVSYYSLHKPHRVPVLKENFNKLHDQRSNGWQRVMARKGVSVQNRYIPIRDEQNHLTGTLVLSSNVTERESLLRNLTQEVERLNILLQAGQLLTHVADLAQLYSCFQTLLKKIWPVRTIRMLFGAYKGKQDVLIGDENESQNQRMKEILHRKRLENDRGEPIFLQQQNCLLIQQYMDVLLDNDCFIEIVCNDPELFSDNDYHLLKGILNYVQIAIENHLLFSQIQESAVKDQMTGLYNRRYFDMLRKQFQHSKGKVALIAGDINNLKYYNDHFGHEAGDTLICATADILNCTRRKKDMAFRFGGDEFLMILPDAGEREGRQTVEQIEQKIGNWNRSRSQVKLSLSLGYITVDYVESLEELVRLADQKMYAAKQKFKRSQVELQAAQAVK